MSGLPDPDFIARDPAAITAEIIADYEAATGKVLYPAQVEALWINQLAYRETLTRIGIQEAAKQNLVTFARFPMLDYLGELVDCPRQPGGYARVPLRFSFAALAAPMVLPAGIRVQSGTLVFATETAAVGHPGDTQVDVWAACQTEGAVGNGLAAGSLTQILDNVPPGVSVANTDVSGGGTDVEENTPYRARVAMAWERAACGSFGSYRFNALSVDASITDVGVSTDADGQVTVSALTAAGPANGGLLDAIRTQLNRDDLRPLTDQVVVIAPARIGYQIDLRVTLLNGSPGAAVQSAAIAALQAYAADRRAALGQDLVTSQIEQPVQALAGVYSVRVVSPAPRVLGPHEWADAELVSVSVESTVHG